MDYIYKNKISRQVKPHLFTAKLVYGFHNFKDRAEIILFEMKNYVFIFQLPDTDMTRNGSRQKQFAIY